MNGWKYVVPPEVRDVAPLYCGWLADNAIEAAYVPPFMIEELRDWIREDPGREGRRRGRQGVRGGRQ